jgi:hypothetical protein
MPVTDQTTANGPGSTDALIVEQPAAPPPHRSPRWAGPTVVVVLALAGLAVRIWITTGRLGAIDSDAAITGLMGRHFLDGDFRAFMWRLNHHGTIAVFPVALSLRILGMHSRFAMELPFVLMSAGSSVLVWRVGTRFLSAFAAVFAGLAFWLWPALFVWLGVYPYLAYVPLVLLGLGVILCAQRAVEGRTASVDWCLAGLFAGLGFWTSPTIDYFVIPVAIWLLVFHARKLWPRALLAVPFAALGALPWIWNDWNNGWDSLRSPDGLAQGSYLDHLRYAFTHALPTALGMRGFSDGRWIFGAAGWYLYAAALVALAVGVWRGLRAHSPAAIGMLACPFLFAAVPFASNLNGDGIGNGRYFFFFGPYVVLTIAHLVRPVVPAVIVAVVLAVSSIWGFSRLYDYRESIGVARPLDGVIARLEREGHHDVFASFWISSRMTFESGEKVIAVATDLGPTLQAYEDRVRVEASLPVYVFDARDTSGIEIVTQRATDAGMTVKVEHVGNYVIVVPSSRLVAPPPLDVSSRP